MLGSMHSLVIGVASIDAPSLRNFPAILSGPADKMRK